MTALAITFINSNPALAVKGPQIITGNYLMAFHTCDESGAFVNTSCSGSLASTSAGEAAESSKGSSSSALCSQADEFTTILSQSNDGVNWTNVTGWNTCSFTAGVPDVIRRNDTIYVYAVFQGTVYVSTVNAVTGDITAAQAVEVSDGLGGTEELVDPSPLLIRDGSNYKIVLAYLQNNNSGGDPAACATYPCTQVFRTATETSSMDGIHFTAESGNRVEVTLNSSSDTASDPDIFWGPEGYVMLIARGQGFQAYRSVDLHGTYSPISTLTDGYLVTTASGDAYSYSLSAGYFDNASSTYFIYAVGVPLGGSATTPVIRRATASSLNSPIDDSDFSTTIDPTSYSGLGSRYSVSSPSIAPNRRQAIR